MANKFETGDRVICLHNIANIPILSIGDVGTIVSFVRNGVYRVVFDSVAQAIQNRTGAQTTLMMDYELTKKEEQQMFNLNDLQAGMVIQKRDGGLRIVADLSDGRKILVASDDLWCDLGEYNNNLTHRSNKERDIVKVYGKSQYAINAIKVHLGTRQLIWEESKPVKEMTVAEISQMLGYEVKVVK